MLDQGDKGREGGVENDRRKIVVRAAVAAGLIAVLLTSLFMFEQSKLADDEPRPSVVSTPDIGVALSSGAGALPEEVQTAIMDAPDMAQTALAPISAPAEQTVVSEPVPVVPEGSKDDSVKPILSPPAQPVAARADPRTGKPARGDRLLIDVPRPAPSTAASAPVPIKVAPAAALAIGGFVVQLGVFTNSTNAEELRAKLKQAGIPSQLETRVQVGPFASKDDAIRAQDKLRALGLGGGMLVAPKKP